MKKLWWSRINNKRRKEFNAKVIVEEIKGFGRSHKTVYEVAGGDIIIASDSDITLESMHVIVIGALYSAFQLSYIL